MAQTGGILVPDTYTVTLHSGPNAFKALGSGALLDGLGNGIPGVIFGWLYWRRGLVAAMTAEAAADVLTKAVLPLLGMG